MTCMLLLLTDGRKLGTHWNGLLVEGVCMCVCVCMRVCVACVCMCVNVCVLTQTDLNLCPCVVFVHIQMVQGLYNLLVMSYYSSCDFICKFYFQNF